MSTTEQLCQLGSTIAAKGNYFARNNSNRKLIEGWWIYRVLGIVPLGRVVSVLEEKSGVCPWIVRCWRSCMHLVLHMHIILELN
eukprot:gene5023-10053_t